jgi:hypothetical protein
MAATTRFLIRQVLSRGNGAKRLKFIDKSVWNSRVDAVASTFRGIRNYARNASVQGLDSEVE